MSLEDRSQVSPSKVAEFRNEWDISEQTAENIEQWIWYRNFSNSDWFALIFSASSIICLIPVLLLDSENPLAIGGVALWVLLVFSFILLDIGAKFALWRSNYSVEDVVLYHLSSSFDQFVNSGEEDLDSHRLYLQPLKTLLDEMDGYHLSTTERYKMREYVDSVLTAGSQSTFENSYPLFAKHIIESVNHAKGGPITTANEIVEQKNTHKTSRGVRFASDLIGFIKWIVTGRVGAISFGILAFALGWQLSGGLQYGLGATGAVVALQQAVLGRNN